MRRPGLWVANGAPTNATQMYSWKPGAITCYFDFLSPNRVLYYKAQHPDTIITIRFQHHLNWQENPPESARTMATEIIAKWPSIRNLDPYIYFGNEMNLYVENGDSVASNQGKYETREFYKKYAGWVRMIAQRIKDQVPEMKLVTPPFAFGHNEDGAPDDSGRPKLGWAGYDYLSDMVHEYFDDILCFHAYWGYTGGSVASWLHDEKESSWFAFRWRRLLKLFETRYHIKAKVIIDEAGNFGAHDADFTEQVMYFSRECLKDPRVLALTFFLWEDSKCSPWNLPNSWTQNCRNIEQHINRLRDMPDIAVETPVNEKPVAEKPATEKPATEKPATDRPKSDYPSPNIRILMADGKVKTMPVEEYLRGVVPQQMSPQFDISALKAQAVTARSFAAYALENPRHAESGANLCTKPGHCQAYDAKKTHANADQAIAVTAGLILRNKNKPAKLVFTANCGGHTSNNEDVAKEKALPYLRGVVCASAGPRKGAGVGLCQQGAQDMALGGASYEKILSRYFLETALSLMTTQKPATLRGKVITSDGKPVANLELYLQIGDTSLKSVTDAKGEYVFKQVTPDNYDLLIPSYRIKRKNVKLTSGSERILNIKIDNVHEAKWALEIQRDQGLPLIVGDLGEPNRPLVFVDPFGNVIRAISGSKADLGSGGFEIWATHRGIYLLQYDGVTFSIPMDGQHTQISLVPKEIQQYRLMHLNQSPPEERQDHSVYYTNGSRL
jgi:hypothetical protein